MTRDQTAEIKPAADVQSSGGLDYQLLFEESPDVLLVLLPDAPRFTMVAATNSRLRATHTTRESIGRGLFEIFPDNPEDPSATGTNNLRASLERVLHSRQPDTMPVQKYDIRGPDGTFEARYWSPKNLPVLSATGQVLYILHRVEDVTQLVRASELGEELRGRTRDMEREILQRSHELAGVVRELRDANGKLSQLDEAKTVFFSNISHEFRTPLTLMLGPLEDELAESRQPLPPHRRQRLETAHRNSVRLLRLVNSLLEFARIEAGRVQALYQPTDLSAFTAELASNFRSVVERGGLSLNVECPALPEAIYVDREMWEKIVLNLISNAFKHTFEGSITVRLTQVEGTVQLSIADTGIGIPPEEIGRLFDRFHRVKGAASRTHEGSGIGLSLVRELVHLHAGEISVDSEPGRGSRFLVTLRAGAGHLPADKIGASAQTATLRETSTAYVQETMQWLPAAAQSVSLSTPSASIDPAGDDQSGGRTRILWAEDNADMREYVARLLGSSYDVLPVPDGQAALEAALATPPDLVLSDVMMPRLDGIGLLKALRADERTQHLPVILLSARAGEESAIDGLDAGADDYLLKPFTARELLARVRTHVQLAQQRRAWESELEQRIQERTAELASSVEALASENTRRQISERRLESQLRRMGLLDDITRAIADRHDLDSVFQVVVRNVEKNLPAEICWIGLTESIPQDATLPTELLYEPDVRSESAGLLRSLAGPSIHSMVTAPLRAQEKMLGVLIAGRREPHSFSSGECEFLRQLGEHVALAVHQGQLHESLRIAYDNLHESQRTALQQERLRALGQMASGIAHDINNAISPVALYVESLLESDPTLSPRARQYLPIVLRAIDDVAATVARMREFYRSRDAQISLLPVQLNELIEQVIDLTRARWSDMPLQRGSVIDVVRDLAPELPAVPGIESEIREALTNLIFNAVDAMPDGGRLTLRTRSVDGHVRLQVEDTGVGMDEETARKCLEPFFTTKGERGTGLGLAMVYGALQRHSANIQIDSAPGRGSHFIISFPIWNAGNAERSEPEEGTRAVAPLRILIIDDDPLVLSSLKTALESDGHMVVAADDPRQGLELFASRLAAEPFELVITDLGMPYLDGRAVARTIKESSQTTRVILLTGWGQGLDSDGHPLQHVDCVLGKPPKMRELRAALAPRR